MKFLKFLITFLLIVTVSNAQAWKGFVAGQSDADVTETEAEALDEFADAIDGISTAQSNVLMSLAEGTYSEVLVQLAADDDTMKFDPGVALYMIDLEVGNVRMFAVDSTGSVVATATVQAEQLTSTDDALIKNVLTLGDDVANSTGSLLMIASDNDQGTLGINTSDAFVVAGFSGGFDIDGDFTAGTITSDADVSGTTITASTGFVAADGDYIGIPSNELITFNAAGTVAISGANLTVSGNVQSATNVGTSPVGTSVAADYGDGYNHVTVLALTDFIIGTPNAANNDDFGNIVYTFPAGVQVVGFLEYNLALTVGTQTDDTPEIGIGSVVANGASATLAGTEMDYMTSNAWATTLDGVAAEAAGPLGATAGIFTGIALNQSGDVKDVCLNAADGWHASVTGNLTATGTITIVWTTIE